MMPRHLTCAAQYWLVFADPILAVTPVTEVTLTTWPIIWHEGGFEHLRYRFEMRTRWWHDVLLAAIVEKPTDQTIHETLLRAEWPEIKFNLPSLTALPLGYAHQIVGSASMS
jgi:hypothetical protein